jgi:hypothetical protein
MTTFDPTYWLKLAEAVTTISAPIILGFCAAWLKQHLKLANGSAASTILDLLVTSTSQSIVSAIAKAPQTAAPIDVHNPTVAAVLNNLSDSAQAAMKLKNVTPETLAARIDGAVQIALVPPAAPAKT